MSKHSSNCSVPPRKVWTCCAPLGQSASSVGAQWPSLYWVVGCSHPSTVTVTSRGPGRTLDSCRYCRYYK